VKTHSGGSLFASTTEVAICRSGMYLVVTVLPDAPAPPLTASPTSSA